MTPSSVMFSVTISSPMPFPRAGSRRLARSVPDAEVPDEGDHVAVGIEDGG
jgi:hypothetical protein